MSKTLGYKKVEEICSFRFEVPSYQRGYRWNKKNIEQLFDDIYGLSHSNEMKKNNEYYLNQLIVDKEFLNNVESGENKNNEIKLEKFTVIDGQQRLTTIYIMICAIKYVYGSDKIQSCFMLEYKSRNNSEIFLKVLLELSENKNIKLEEFENNQNKLFSNLGVEKNIDLEYFLQSFITCVKKFTELKSKYKDVNPVVTLFNCKFIWYQIEYSKDSNSKEEQILQFSKINTGKIPLTNADLIKATLLNYNSFKNLKDDEIKFWQLKISERWNYMEKELHKKELWGFIPHEMQYDVFDENSSRISYLFEFLMYNKIIEKIIYELGVVQLKEEYREFKKNLVVENLDFVNKEYILLDNTFKIALIEKYTKQSIIIYKESLNVLDRYDLFNRFTQYFEINNLSTVEVWNEIEKIFDNFVDSYENDVAQNNEFINCDIFNLLSLCVNLNVNLKKETSFIDNYALFYKIFNTNRDMRLGILKENLKKLLFDGKDIRKKILEMEYGKEEKIREVLLMYNIVLMHKSKGVGNKFNFLEYCNKIWTREHIFPQNIKSKNNNVTNVDDKSLNKNRKELREQQKKLLEAITKNLDVNGKIIIKKEYTLMYINYLNEKLNSNQQTLENRYNGKIIDGLANAGIIDFNKDMDILKKHLDENKENKENEDYKYLHDYINKVYLLKSSYEALNYIKLTEKIEKCSNCNNITALAIWIVRENSELIKDLVFFKIDKTDFSVFRTVNSLIIDFKSKLKILEINECDIQNDKYKIKEFIDSININYNIVDFDDNYQFYNKQIVYELNLKLINVFKEKINEISKIDTAEDLINKLENNDLFGDVAKVIQKCDSNEKLEEECKKIGVSVEFLDKILLETIKKLNMMVEKLFSEEIEKHLKDDTMGNMALLDSRVNGSKEIGNNLFHEKRNNVYKFFKEGEFIPLSTMLTFAGNYNRNQNNDVYWLFESRLNYIDDIITTIEDFFKEK